MRLYLKDINELSPWFLGVCLAAIICDKYFKMQIDLLLYLFALVSGSIIFGKESESKTISFLEALPVTKKRIWFSKILNTLSVNLFLVGVLILYFLAKNNGHNYTMFCGKGFFPNVSMLFNITAFSVLSSIIMKKTISAIFGALLGLFLFHSFFGLVFLQAQSVFIFKGKFAVEFISVLYLMSAVLCYYLSFKLYTRRG